MYACMHFLCANIPQEQYKDIHVPRKTLWRQDNVSTWYRFVARCPRHDGQSVISQFCIWVCIVLRMWHSLAALYLYLMDYGISCALSRTRYYGSGFLVRTPSSFCVCHWIIIKRQLQLLIVWLPKCSLLIAVLLDVWTRKLLQCGEWMWVGHLHLDKIRCFVTNESVEDSEQERQRSAKEVEELQQQLSKAAVDAWMKVAECVESCWDNWRDQLEFSI